MIGLIDPQVANTLLIVAALILLPMVPAVLIYKMLPNQRVLASGSFGGMQLKATGAVGFYAFVLVVAVGVQKIAAENPDPLEFETWTVIGTVRLADPTDSIPKGAMTVEVFPPSVDETSTGPVGRFQIRAPVMKNQSGGTNIQVSVPRYLPVPLSLNQDSDPAQSYRVKRDPVHRVLTIDNIVLRKPEAQYAGGPAVNSTPAKP
jgi:hypothetical protein